MTYLLENQVLTHPWGSPTVIPEMLGVPANGEPQAELWLGAHPKAPSIARTPAGPVPLDQLIRQDPGMLLGRALIEQFGPRLPFLLKVLAVERPLSIQAHPGATQAAAGYAAEMAAGVAPAHRSFSDPFHKPELVLALTDFTALIGFRVPTDAEELISDLDVPALKEAAEMLRAPDGLAETVGWILTLAADRAAELATAVAQACAVRAGSEPFATLAGISWLFPADRGVLVALVLDHVRLAPGEAYAVPAGTPHCYLRGVAVEAQANSDNTLRAGLTPKKVDVPELLAALRYRPTDDLRARPSSSGDVDVFALADVPDFRLARVRLRDDAAHPPGDGPRIVLVTDGRAILRADGAATVLHRGQSAFVPASQPGAALSGAGTAFVVGV